MIYEVEEGGMMEVHICRIKGISPTGEMFDFNEFEDHLELVE